MVAKTNPYFNNYNYEPTQSLIQDLADENISIHGSEYYYSPHTAVALDPVLGEDVLRQFDIAIPIEMYLETPEQYTGPGQLLSKFGFQSNRLLTLSVSRRRFYEEITSQYPELDIQQPKEGDLIWSSLHNILLDIKYVQNDELYQLQLDDPTNITPYVYQVECELHIYTNESINTGVFDIDDVRYQFENTEDLSNIASDNLDVQINWQNQKDNSDTNPFGFE